MKPNLITKILQESKKSKKLIGIRKYDDGDNFWCGYVADYTDRHVVIQHYTKYGKPDGFIMVEIESIESIDTDDHYMEAYQYLVQNSHKLDKQTAKLLKPVGKKNWQFDTLKQLKNSKAICCIELNGDVQITGFVRELDESFVQMKCISRLGEDEGNSLYRLSDITTIDYDDLESRKRKLFYNWKNKK